MNPQGQQMGPQLPTNGTGSGVIRPLSPQNYSNQPITGGNQDTTFSGVQNPQAQNFNTNQMNPGMGGMGMNPMLGQNPGMRMSGQMQNPGMGMPGMGMGMGMGGMNNMGMGGMGGMGMNGMGGMGMGMDQNNPMGMGNMNPNDPNCAQNPLFNCIAALINNVVQNRARSNLNGPPPPLTADGLQPAVAEPCPVPFIIRKVKPTNPCCVKRKTGPYPSIYCPKPKPRRKCCPPPCKPCCDNNPLGCQGNVSNECGPSAGGFAGAACTNGPILLVQSAKLKCPSISSYFVNPPHSLKSGRCQTLQITEKCVDDKDKERRGSNSSRRKSSGSRKGSDASDDSKKGKKKRRGSGSSTSSNGSGGSDDDDDDDDDDD